LKTLPLKKGPYQKKKMAIEGMQLKEFIKSLPQGLDTALFPEGKQLSSSNAQKLLLARSIIVDPRFYFMKTLQTTWMTKLPMK
jgi:ABC-type multidrug transport system fused ATPase/permease subunit